MIRLIQVMGVFGFRWSCSSPVRVCGPRCTPTVGAGRKHLHKTCSIPPHVPRLSLVALSCNHIEGKTSN